MIVLLNHRTEEVYVLNDVGLRIWQLAAAGFTLKTIAARIHEEYDAPAEAIVRDVASVLRRLHRAGLLVITHVR